MHQDECNERDRPEDWDDPEQPTDKIASHESGEVGGEGLPLPIMSFRYIHLVKELIAVSDKVKRASD